ncbi:MULTISPECIES: ABC transporter permease [unclassified Pseudactinotalea]|uniref:ABC transporter permease n=1 Tax=Micrococcales TaxID=85006 RepID=UPI003C7A0E4A
MPERVLPGHRVPGPWAIVRAATRTAFADMRATYTPLTWSVGWLGRILMQVTFFALIGLLLDDPGAVLYLFIGQAVMACVVEVFMSVPSTTWERFAGTMGLLVAAPGPLWPVFVGRSVQWLPSGIATAGIALFALGPLFGVGWSLAGALGAFAMLVLTATTMYAVALFVAALVLRGPRWRNVASNVSHTLVMLITGVTVPTLIWPAWLQVAGQGLPITHGLGAIRDLQAGTADAGSLAVAAGAALGAGLVWFALAAVAFTAFAGSGRRDGSIDLQE